MEAYAWSDILRFREIAYYPKDVFVLYWGELIFVRVLELGYGISYIVHHTPFLNPNWGRFIHPHANNDQPPLKAALQ